MAIGRHPLQPAAQDGGQAVGGEDENDENKEDGCRLAAVQHLHGLIHELAEAAGADEAHHHGGADGAFPAIDGVGNQFPRCLGQKAVEDGQRPAGAAAAQGLGRPSIDGFEDFRIDLGQHAAVGQPQGQHPRRRPETEDAHENQRPD